MSVGRSRRWRAACLAWGAVTLFVACGRTDVEELESVGGGQVLLESTGSESPRSGSSANSTDDPTVLAEAEFPSTTSTSANTVGTTTIQPAPSVADGAGISPEATTTLSPAATTTAPASPVVTNPPVIEREPTPTVPPPIAGGPSVSIAYPPDGQGIATVPVGLMEVTATGFTPGALAATGYCDPAATNDLISIAQYCDYEIGAVIGADGTLSAAIEITPNLAVNGRNCTLDPCAVGIGSLGGPTGFELSFVLIRVAS